MSLFRKPKKIQRRVFCADDDEDGEPEVPPPPVISQEKRDIKPVKCTPLLSFVDEEEDGEVFKVKKSSQSKRLAKRKEKEKQRQIPEGDNNKYDNNSYEDNGHHMDVDEDVPQAKKKVTLEGLILSGREALAADGAGDVSDDAEEVEVEEEDSRGFHQYRAESVRAALAGAPGYIPDAALIHAARKTRQQARELGGDFIPIQTENAAGSRLIRDDDGSADDEEEGRLHVRGLDLPSDKPKRGTALGSPDEEMNSDVEVWEEQQMQKAMPVSIDLTGDNTAELNPFALAPAPPQLKEVAGHLRPLLGADSQPASTAQDLVDALRKRLQELRTERDDTAMKKVELEDRLINAARMRENRASRCAGLDAAYKRAQAARGYLTDLVECLDEKMPQLEALEARALAMHKGRCEFLVERRRADVRDQAQDVLAMAARPGSLKHPDTEEKIRRTAEREGRRRARRLKRESAAAATGSVVRHRDGDSSDDDLPPLELHQYTQERDSIRSASASLFSDALRAWRGVNGVCARLAAWRRRHPALYCEAYLPHCLPRLIAPYVRHQLVLWNPLADEDNEDYERMDWYKCLMMYGVRSKRVTDESCSSSSEEDTSEEPPLSENSVRDDPDLFLVPAIVRGVVLPKLTELVECAWDPLCVRAAVRLRQLVVRVAVLPASTQALRGLAAAIAARASAALNADVFLPALPPNIMEGCGGAFWRRCVGSGVRLLRALLALAGPPPLLRVDPLVLSLIETLSCGAGAAPGTYMCAGATALVESLPRGGELRAAALRRLASLARLALSRLETDNPLHLKALEQARTIISEARSAE